MNFISFWPISDPDRDVQVSRRTGEDDLLGAVVWHVSGPGDCQLHLQRLQTRDGLLQQHHAIYGGSVHRALHQSAHDEEVPDIPGHSLPPLGIPSRTKVSCSSTHILHSDFVPAPPPLDLVLSSGVFSYSDFSVPF